MQRRFVGSLAVAVLVAVVVVVSLLEGQPMNEEQVMKFLKEFVALEPNEIPGFNPTKPFVRKWEAGKGFSLYQSLFRKGTGIPGRDPTEIFIHAGLATDRDTAYQAAISMIETQVFHFGAEPGRISEGSWTGLPIGEKSWATAPKTGPGVSFTSNLVVWDDRLALRIIVRYPPLDPKAKNLIILPIEGEDLELGELAARIILAKATLVLIGWEQLPSLRLVVNGTSLRAKGSQGSLFVPVGLVMKALGCEGERKGGIWVGRWRGKKVTFPIGARCVLVGDWSVEVLRKGRSGVKRMKGVEGKVGLKVPVLYDGREIWVEGEGLAKALGLKLEQKGQTIALLPK
jgi:hypothetical protein